jgi:hypothetical protein
MLINDMSFRENKALVERKGRPCRTCGVLTCRGIHLPECPRCQAMRKMVVGLRRLEPAIRRWFPVEGTAEIVDLDEKALRPFATSRRLA